MNYLPCYTKLQLLICYVNRNNFLFDIFLQLIENLIWIFYIISENNYFYPRKMRFLFNMISFDILRKMIRYPRAQKSLCNYLKLFDLRYIRHTQLSARRCCYGTSKIYLSSKSPLLSCEKNQQLPWIRLARVGTQARSEAALRYFRARVSFKVSRVILKCTVYDDFGVLHDFGSLWKSSKTKRHEKITIRRKIKDLWRYCSRKKIMRRQIK